MSHSHSDCHPHDHDGHAHGHGQARKGLHFLHNLVVHNELPVLKEGVTWSTGGLWLDYGCGDGWMGRDQFLPLAEQNNAKIIGIDIREKSIEKAKQLGLPENIITFAKGSISGDWPLADEIKFDKVLAIHVLQYFSDYKEFFTKISEKLNPGAELGITLPISKLFQVYDEIKKHDKWRKFNSIDTTEVLPEYPWTNNSDFMPQLKVDVIQLGFQLKTLEFLPFSHNFQNLNAFGKSVAEAWGEMKKIENFESLEEVLTKDVCEIIKKVYPEIPEDSSPWPMEISSAVIILQKP